MKKIMKITIITILILILSIVGIKAISLKKKLQKQKKAEIKEEIPIKSKEKEEEKKEIKSVYVDIKGAVINPGVYELEETKKVIDVINVAGGFKENADTSMINLAKKVANEMVIIIYTKEEVAEATKPNQIVKYVDKQCICPQIKNDACLNNSTKESSNQKNSSQEKEETTTNKDTVININTATLEELQSLSGIGTSKAEAIIAYREEKGGFKNIEELKEVSGIGESLYEKIKEHITV